MKVLHWQRLILIYSNMCKENNISFSKKLLLILFDIINRCAGTYIIVCSIIYIYYTHDSSQIEHLIQAVFQITATITLQVIITTLSWNKKRVCMILDKIQKLVDECKLECKLPRLHFN